LVDACSSCPLTLKIEAKRCSLNDVTSEMMLLLPVWREKLKYVVDDFLKVRWKPYCIATNLGNTCLLILETFAHISWHYQIFWEVVGLEWGPLSLVSITEELLDRKVAAPV
jgi:hypothetical protein